MLDVLVALAGGEAHVRARDIVLQIDEGLAARGHLPERGDRRRLGIGRQLRGQPGPGRRATELGGDRARRALAVAGRCSKSKDAARGARHLTDRGSQIRGEGGDRFPPVERRAQLARERGRR